MYTDMLVYKYVKIGLQGLQGFKMYTDMLVYKYVKIGLKKLYTSFSFLQENTSVYCFT